MEAHLHGSRLEEVRQHGSEDLYSALLELGNLLSRRAYDPPTKPEIETALQRAEFLVSEKDNEEP
jgi:hypothetical protein